MAKLPYIMEDLVKQAIADIPLTYTDGTYWAYSDNYWVPLRERVMTHFTRVLGRHKIYRGRRETARLIRISDPRLGRALESYINRSPELERDDFFGLAARGFTMRNGFLHLSDAGVPELLPHAPSHASRYFLDADYQPGAECPYSLMMLASYFTHDKEGDGPAKQRAILEFLAVCLFGQANTDNRGAVLLIHGEAKCGKTSLIQNLCESAFDMNGELRGQRKLQGMVSNVDPHNFADENERLKMVGRVLNYYDEVESKAIRNPGLLKAIISGTPVSVKALYKDKATARIRAGHLIMGNEKPLMADPSGALQSRTIPVHFTHKYDRPYESPQIIAAAMRAERSGLINHLCRVYREMLERNGGHPRITVPESAQQAQEESTFEANAIARFAREMCISGESCRARSAEVHAIWKQWCIINNVAVTMQITAKALTKALAELLPYSMYGKDDVFHGVRFRDPTSSLDLPKL